MVNNKGAPPPPQIVVVWYQAPQSVALSKDKLPYYEGLLVRLGERVDLFPSLSLDFIACPVTDTINLAGEIMIFAGLESDLRNAGFRAKEIPNEGMTPEERLAFREALLHGGKLH